MIGYEGVKGLENYKLATEDQPRYTVSPFIRMNADRDATDYKKEVIKISSGEKVKIKLAPGGGWVARIEKMN